MLVHCRVTPSIKFAGTHLYTWVERGTVRVMYLAQEDNTMSPARAEPGLLDPESSSLTMRPLRLPTKVAWVVSKNSLNPNNILTKD